MSTHIADKQVQLFSKLFYAELCKENWGMIDPWMFKAISNHENDDSDWQEAVCLKKCLTKTLKKFIELRETHERNATNTTNSDSIKIKQRGRNS